MKVERTENESLTLTNWVQVSGETSTPSIIKRFANSKELSERYDLE